MKVKSVFSQHLAANSEIESSHYNAIIGACLLWGFGVNYVMVETLDIQALAQMNQWVFIGLFLIFSLGGAYLFNSSDKPAISFLGYNMVVIPFGAIVALSVSQYDPDIVSRALVNTGLITGVMMLLGTMYPAFFSRISKALFISLLVTVIVELILIFVFKKHVPIIDWIVVLIFCGYIGYDWGRANQIPKTVDNAIDSAASLYMDIINLFLRILRIMGRD